MKQKHTPGPWEAKAYVGNWAVIHRKDCAIKNIALLPYGEANAHLIAAAPELLEAVDRLLTWNHGGQRAEDVAFARAAFAKATGVQEESR
jgi:hypothetical protein